MPQYVLRDIPVDLWAKFTERAKREQWPLRALFLKLLEDYGSGTLVRLSGAPPEQMPLYAWMRPYYRDLARKDPQFHALDGQIQWERLVESISKQRPGQVAQLPIERARQVLNWLHDTSRDLRPGPNKLSMRAIAHIGDGPGPDVNRHVFQYEVLGLPPGQQAWIAESPHKGWKVLRVENGRQGEWEGHFADADEAREALEVAVYLQEDIPGDTEHS